MFSQLALDTVQECVNKCGAFGSGEECVKACRGISNPALGNKLQGFSGIGFFQTLIPNLVGLAFVIGVIIFFFMLLIGAIQWLSSGGDKGNLEAARGRLTSALIGIVVLFSIFAIIKIVENFFGIHILTLDIGPLIIK